MSSGFVAESELADLRKKRQEEWDRVRKADDPIERPEEPYDYRSLYERLQEQKQKKGIEYEEAHKLKNMIKGLDDDEVEFLDLVDRTKLAADRKKELEEELELNDYRNRVATLQEKSLEERLQAETNTCNKPKIMSNRMSQQKLLQGVVIKKRKASDDTDNLDNNIQITKQIKFEEAAILNKKCTEDGIATNNTGLQCIAILPGLGCYNDSSSEENSDSDSDQEKFDMLGRKVIEKFE